jgi:hypothetical protein
MNKSKLIAVFLLLNFSLLVLVSCKAKQQPNIPANTDIPEISVMNDTETTTNPETTVNTQTETKSETILETSQNFVGYYIENYKFRVTAIEDDKYDWDAEVFSSKSELDLYINGKTFTPCGDYVDYYPESFDDLIKNYDNEFFEKNTLVLYFDQRGDFQVIDNVIEVYKSESEDVLEICFTTKNIKTPPEPNGPCKIYSHCIFVEVPIKLLSQTEVKFYGECEIEFRLNEKRYGLHNIDEVDEAVIQQMSKDERERFKVLLSRLNEQAKEIAANNDSYAIQYSEQLTWIDNILNKY